jgi:hypothetical protein
MLGLYFRNNPGRIAGAAILTLFVMGGIATIIVLKSGMSPKLPAPAPIAQGRQVYSVTTGGTGPKITEVAIDPFDPKKGNVQSIEVKTSSPDVAHASVRLLTDHGSSSYEFVHATSTVSGDAILRASWITNDTHDRVYGAAVTVIAVSGASSTIELSFR